MQSMLGATKWNTESPCANRKVRDRSVFHDVSSRRKEIPATPNSENSSLFVPEAGSYCIGFFIGPYTDLVEMSAISDNTSWTA